MIFLITTASYSLTPQIISICEWTYPTGDTCDEPSQIVVMGTEDSEAISSKRRRVTKTVKTSTSQPQQNSSAVSLDETLDEFASGFTPYRMAATRGSRKLSRAKKSSTTTKKDETDTGKQNKSTSSVVSQEKGESSVSQPTETGESLESWAPSQYKTVFAGMAIPMSNSKIRRSRDRVIFNMGIPILVRRYLYIDRYENSWF